MKRISELRGKIDELDEELIILLEKRFQHTKKIMQIKDSNNLPRTNIIREQQIINTLHSKTNLNEELIRKMMNLIFEEAKNA